MMDDKQSVTIEEADNGYMVRMWVRGKATKGEPHPMGYEKRSVAKTIDEALEIAKSYLNLDEEKLGRKMKEM